MIAGGRDEQSADDVPTFFLVEIRIVAIDDAYAVRNCPVAVPLLITLDVSARPNMLWRTVGLFDGQIIKLHMGDFTLDIAREVRDEMHAGLKKVLYKLLGPGDEIAGRPHIPPWSSNASS